MVFAQPFMSPKAFQPSYLLLDCLPPALDIPTGSPLFQLLNHLNFLNHPTHASLAVPTFPSLWNPGVGVGAMRVPPPETSDKCVIASLSL